MSICNPDNWLERPCTIKSGSRRADDEGCQTGVGRERAGLEQEQGKSKAEVGTGYVQDRSR